MTTPSIPARPRRGGTALAAVLLTLALASALFALAHCGNGEAPGAATASSTGAAPDKAAASASAPPASADTSPAGVGSAAPPTSAAPSTSASVAPVASAAPSLKPIADAGAPTPADAGSKPAKDAGALADAGATAAADAGALSPAAALAKQIDAIYAGKKTFSAKFKQEYALKVSNQTKKSSGVVFIERPNKISFRYDPPNKNRIVSDGTTLRVYIADDNQMIEKPVQNSQYPGAFGFLMGNGISSSFNFIFNEKAVNPAGPVLFGKPVSPTPDYESTMFFIDKALLEKSDPGAVAKVLVVDAQGNKNRFELTDAAQPASIDPGEFTFTPPPGTNVIH